MLQKIKPLARHKHAKWPPSDLTPWTLTLQWTLWFSNFFYRNGHEDLLISFYRSGLNDLVTSFYRSGYEDLFSFYRSGLNCLVTSFYRRGHEDLFISFYRSGLNDLVTSFYRSGHEDLLISSFKRSGLNDLVYSFIGADMRIFLYHGLFQICVGVVFWQLNNGAFSTFNLNEDYGKKNLVFPFYSSQNEIMSKLIFDFISV